MDESTSSKAKAARARRDGWPDHCRAALTKALAKAESDLPRALEGDARAVHAARLRLRKARALARLFGAVAGPAADNVITGLGALRRQFGARRDHDVASMVLERIAPALDARTRTALEATLATRAMPAPADASPIAALAHDDPLGVARRWHPRGIGGRELAAGAAKVYAKARRRARRAFAAEPPDPEALHAFRKTLIDHRHHIKTLAPAWPEVFSAWEKALHRLRDDLGALHDFAMVVALAGEAGLTKESRARLDATIAARSRPRLARARLAHDRLFAERPRAFRARLEAILATSPPAPRAPGKD